MVDIIICCNILLCNLSYEFIAKFVLQFQNCKTLFFVYCYSKHFLSLLEISCIAMYYNLVIKRYNDNLIYELINMTENLTFSCSRPIEHQIDLIYSQLKYYKNLGYIICFLSSLYIPFFERSSRDSFLSNKQPVRE